MNEDLPTKKLFFIPLVVFLLSASIAIFAFYLAGGKFESAAEATLFFAVFLLGIFSLYLAGANYMNWARIYNDVLEEEEKTRSKSEKDLREKRFHHKSKNIGISFFLKPAIISFLMWFYITLFEFFNLAEYEILGIITKPIYLLCIIIGFYLAIEAMVRARLFSIYKMGLVESDPPEGYDSLRHSYIFGGPPAERKKGESL